MLGTRRICCRFHRILRPAAASELCQITRASSDFHVGSHVLEIVVQEALEDVIQAPLQAWKDGANDGSEQAQNLAQHPGPGRPHNISFCFSHTWCRAPPASASAGSRSRGPGAASAGVLPPAGWAATLEGPSGGRRRGAVPAPPLPSTRLGQRVSLAFMGCPAPGCWPIIPQRGNACTAFRVLLRSLLPGRPAAGRCRSASCFRPGVSLPCLSA